ncbi:MAG: hypothetical protein WA081_04700 [Desulfosalsimonadaceae bacterium]
MDGWTGRTGRKNEADRVPVDLGEISIFRPASGLVCHRWRENASKAPG